MVVDGQVRFDRVGARAGLAQPGATRAVFRLADLQDPPAAGGVARRLRRELLLGDRSRCAASAMRRSADWALVTAFSRSATEPLLGRREPRLAAAIARSPRTRSCWRLVVSSGAS